MNQGTTLKAVCDLASDLYYQGKQPDDAPFSVPYFKQLVSGFYANIINEEYNINKAKMRSQTGHSFVEFGSDWLVTERLELKEDADRKLLYAETKGKVQSFQYDSMNSGLQYVNSLGKVQSFKRISANDIRKVHLIPKQSAVLYFISDGKIFFYGLYDKSEKIEVRYLPMLDVNKDDCIISEEKKMYIVTSVLNLMFSAKKGETADETNNSNQNTNITQTEADLKTLKN